jgi:hypothetical protein
VAAVGRGSYGSLRSTTATICSLDNATTAEHNVPQVLLIQFSGVASDEGGNSLRGAVSITLSLYDSQQGGEPLWTETQQSFQLDSTGALLRHHEAERCAHDFVHVGGCAQAESADRRASGTTSGAAGQRVVRTQNWGCNDRRRFASFCMRLCGATEWRCGGIHG